MSQKNPPGVPAHYQRYIDLAGSGPVSNALVMAGDQVNTFLRDIPEPRGDYRYAPDKWTVKTLVNHVIDTERIMAYRALRFARGDDTPLAGYEDDHYAQAAQAGRRRLYALANEFTNVRAATIDLFESFDDAMLGRVGTANGVAMPVSDWGRVVVGHALHHIQILQTRYFAQAGS